MPERAADAIVCFSMSEWGDVPHNSRHLMSVARGRGYRVLYVETIGLRAPRFDRQDAAKILRRLKRLARPLRRPQPGFWVLSPVAIPLHGRPWVDRLNARLMEVQLRLATSLLRMRRPILWSYSPHFVGLRHALRARHAVYYRTDDYAAMPANDALRILGAERRAVAEADLCVGAAAWYIERGPLRRARRALWLPNAVDASHYADARPDGVFADLGGPVLLMMGTLESWLAQDVLAEVADLRPDWTIVLAGPCRTDIDALVARPNVRYLGVLPYDELPELVESADVCLVPFRAGPVTRGATPGKLYQYLAAGKPVVVTPFLESAELRSQVYVAGEKGVEFARVVERALVEDGPELKAARRRYAAEQTWDARFTAVEEALQNGAVRAGRNHAFAGLVAPGA